MDAANWNGIYGVITMIDRDGVIQSLEACVLRDPDDTRRCNQCPYGEYGKTIRNSCINGLIAMALEYLRSNLPVEPVEEIIGDALYHRCGRCGGTVSRWQNYCSKCGAAVNWNG